MADLLSEDEIDDQLPAGWEREGDEVVRTFDFEEYMHGLAFAQTVAEIAETQNHHPEMTIGYGEVEVRLTTHDEGGVTDADIQMAEFVDGEYDG
jgi:4a-hydroxytetrahydrobiopterin dehydratase